MVDPVKYFERISVRAAVAGSIALLGLIATGDYLIGRELSLASLYLIPVMLITWKTSATAGVAISITFSMGLAAFTTALDSVDEMIKRADMLMYKMKREGKGGISEQVFA